MWGRVGFGSGSGWGGVVSSMWEIRNRTPFASAGTILVDKTGEKYWVVVVKGTFDILDNGETKLSKEQIESLFTSEYRGLPGESSLLYEQDVLPAKLHTDIYLNATAYAPNGRPVNKILVSIETPCGTKTLLVHGDRTWESNLTGIVSASSAKLFTEMPIVYERAYGGYDRLDPNPVNHRLDSQNPVGTGFFTKRRHSIGKSLPNIEYARGGRVNSWAAGYGALSSYWKPRIDYQGTYDDEWIKNRKPLLPDDYNSLTLQCAPPDQQFSSHLRGGEVFSLSNLTPSGILRFYLPKHYLVFTTHIGYKRFEHRSIVNTVIIEPDYPRVMIVWHTTLRCHRDIDYIDYTLVTEKEYS